MLDVQRRHGFDEATAEDNHIRCEQIHNTANRDPEVLRGVGDDCFDGMVARLDRGSQRPALPAPKRYSPYVPASTSLAMTTGQPKSLVNAFFSGTLRKPRFGALSTTPRSRSSQPGQPMPMALSCRWSRCAACKASSTV